MINPLAEIKNKHNWSIQDFATVTDTSSHTIYKNLKGGVLTISEKILKTLENMGYNSKEISKKYQDYRKFKRNKLIEK